MRLPTSALTKASVVTFFAFAASATSMSAMMASSAAFRPSNNACSACAFCPGSSCFQRSSISRIVIGRSPTRAATSCPPAQAFCCACDEQASEITRPTTVKAVRMRESYPGGCCIQGDEDQLSSVYAELYDSDADARRRCGGSHFGPTGADLQGHHPDRVGARDGF